MRFWQNQSAPAWPRSPKRLGAGIAWRIINSDVDYISDLRRHALVPVFTVLSDHETIGKIQGQKIAALLSDPGCVLYLEGRSVRDVAKVRTKGMLATKPPQIVVKTVKGGGLDAEQRLPRR